MKNLGDYHDLDKQNKTLLLCDKFENFREMCIETFDDDLIHICSVPGLVWFAALEKIKIKTASRNWYIMDDWEENLR